MPKSKSKLSTEDSCRSPSKSPCPSSRNLSRSPCPSGNLSRSPCPSRNLSRSPCPSRNLSRSPCPSRNLSRSPCPSRNLSRSPGPTKRLKNQTTIFSLFKNAPDTLTKIFTELPDPDKLPLRLVCKSWRKLLDEIISFKVVLNDDTFEHIENCFKKNSKVNEFIVGYFSQCYPPDGFQFKDVETLTVLQDYRFHIYYDDSNANIGVKPTLAMLMMPESKIERLFNEFNNVEKLNLSSTAVADIKANSFMKSIEFSRLREMNLTIEGHQGQGIDALSDILKNHFETLRIFSLTLDNDEELTLYGEMFDFVGRHSLDAVKRIGFGGGHGSDSNFNFNKDHGLHPVDYAEVLSSLANTRVKSLELFVLSSEGRDRKNLELQLFRAQSILTNLKITNIRPENMPVWRTLPTVLRKCSQTLQTVLIDGCFCNAQRTDPPGPFLGRWIQNCHSLTHFELLVCGIKLSELEKIPRNIKVLCLGHALSSRQIQWILDVFLEVEQLSFPNAFKPISLLQFQRALLLPKLKKLYINSMNCRLKIIRKYAGSLLGLVENENENDKRGDMEFVIERDLLRL